MALSRERMTALEDRYEIWGIDEVRKELEQPDRDEFSVPEVTAFAEAWLDAKEASIRGNKFRKVVLTIVGFVLLGLAIALFLEFWSEISGQIGLTDSLVK